MSAIAPSSSPVAVPLEGSPGLSPMDEVRPDRLLMEDDTRVDWGCLYTDGIFYVVDTGARGPDRVKITLHQDGSVTVEVNGIPHEFDADSARNLRVRVDEGDSVEIDDRRAAADKMADPEPVQVFSHPR